MRLLLLALISVLAAGFAGVKLAGSKQREAVSEKFRSEDRSGERTKRWRAGDLNAWASDRKSKDPFANDWKDWSDGELRKALDDGVRDPEVVIELGDGRRI
ncbi:MAG TPA: hypothetical protein VM511_08375, partial [Luteolibacter sp.]|nr:hypothetical protein [Luteolibacter sp.]